MSKKKLLSEVELTLKKCTEGLSNYDDIYNKIESAASNQRERFHLDLKQEIKRLQKHRENLKNWCSNDTIKEKTQQLREFKQEIEYRMESFRKIEKQTKTKAYSKEALRHSRSSESQPQLTAEQHESKEWLEQQLDTLLQQNTEFEEQLERISSARSGKRHKKRKDHEDESNRLSARLERNKWHVQQMEQCVAAMACIDTSLVDEIKDDVEYYVHEAFDDPHYQPFDDMYVNVLNSNDNDDDDDDVGEHEHEHVRVHEHATLLHGDEDDDNDNGNDNAPTPPTPPQQQQQQQEDGDEEEEEEEDEDEDDDVAPTAKKKDNASEPQSPAQMTTVEDEEEEQDVDLQTSERRGRGQDSSKTKKKTSPTSESSTKHSTSSKKKKRKAKKPASVDKQSSSSKSRRSRKPKSSPSVSSVRSVRSDVSNSTTHSQTVLQSMRLPPTMDASSTASTNVERQQSLASVVSSTSSVSTGYKPSTISQQLLQQPLNTLSTIAPMSSRVKKAASDMSAATMAVLAKNGNNNNNNNRNSNIAAATSTPTSIAAPIVPQQQQQQSTTPTHHRANLTSHHESQRTKPPKHHSHTPSTGSTSNTQQATPHSSSYPELPPFARTLTRSEQHVLDIINSSYEKRPQPMDTFEPSSYVPEQPFATPRFFPHERKAAFDVCNVYALMDLDTLFFVFYFQSGSYAQFMAAKELKVRGWSFHEHYNAWFQRHYSKRSSAESDAVEQQGELPRVAKDRRGESGDVAAATECRSLFGKGQHWIDEYGKYERGTYIFFDRNKSWQMRMRESFKFEYKHLEDEKCVNVDDKLAWEKLATYGNGCGLIKGEIKKTEREQMLPPPPPQLTSRSKTHTSSSSSSSSKSHRTHPNSKRLHTTQSTATSAQTRPPPGTNHTSGHAMSAAAAPPPPGRFRPPIHHRQQYQSNHAGASASASASTSGPVNQYQTR
eukprot:CAMPEP_0202692114 /NCGR_PEP_ID=MMETSP1385-20130828/6581_1 /ASSEMBLY_ACC=CAM_ASM_000861 /TAXON_ID=933848 /ORGANISM="Elphidium margaritaceum" /LENGTH=942 /DNA_ID=CAMNT_0049347591 /DNA_START=32 /DNA_END=2860 /DNA_ORIENTATION=-